VSYDLSESWRIRGGFAQNGRVRGFLAYLLRFGKAARAVDDDEDQTNMVRKLGAGAAPVAKAPPQKDAATSSGAAAGRTR
jgi:hypothetical protein